MENAHLKVFVMIQLEFVSVMQDLKVLFVKVKVNFYHLTTYHIHSKVTER